MRTNQASRRAQSNAARGRITAVHDDKGTQRLDVKVTKGETHTAVERFMQAGLSTHPPIGAEVLISYLGANRTHPVVTAVESNKYRRKNLKPGGAALFDVAGNGVEVTCEPDGLKVDSNGQPLTVRFDDGTTLAFGQGGVTITRGEASVQLDDAGLVAKNGLLVSIKPDRVDLGGLGGARVATEAGLSDKVFSIL